MQKLSSFVFATLLLLLASSVFASSAQASILLDVSNKDVNMVGGTINTQWTSSGINSSTTLSLFLSSESTGIGYVIAENLPHNGSFAWTIPTTLPSAKDYRIYMYTNDKGPSDASERSYPFEIKGSRNAPVIVDVSSKTSIRKNQGEVSFKIKMKGDLSNSQLKMNVSCPEGVDIYNESGSLCTKWINLESKKTVVRNFKFINSKGTDQEAGFTFDLASTDKSFSQRVFEFVKIPAFISTDIVIQPISPLISTESGTNIACNFYRDLTIGSRGDDVSNLQNFLQRKGFLGTSGSDKGYFGSTTKAALAMYQASVGISPADGHFGPLTRVNITNNCNAVPATSIPFFQSNPTALTLPPITNQTSVPLGPTFTTAPTLTLIPRPTIVPIVPIISAPTQESTLASAPVTLIDETKIKEDGEAVLKFFIKEVENNKLIKYWEFEFVCQKDVVINSEGSKVCNGVETTIKTQKILSRHGYVYINGIWKGSAESSSSGLKNLNFYLRGYDPDGNMVGSDSKTIVLSQRVVASGTVFTPLLQNNSTIPTTVENMSPSLTIIKPAYFAATGKQQTVTWTSTGIPSSAKLKLIFKENTTSGRERIIANDIANTGSYTWTVSLASGEYQIILKTDQITTNSRFNWKIPKGENIINEVSSTPQIMTPSFTQSIPLHSLTASAQIAITNTLRSIVKNISALMNK